MRVSVSAAPLALAGALPLSAQAMPAAQPLPLADGQPAIVLASGGCGIAFHRGPFGGCRPNFYRGGYGYRGYGFRGGYGFHRGFRRY